MIAEKRTLIFSFQAPGSEQLCVATVLSGKTFHMVVPWSSDFSMQSQVEICSVLLQHQHASSSTYALHGCQHSLSDCNSR